MISLGKFFFKTRNALFPILAVIIYLLFLPPQRTFIWDVLALVLVVSGVFMRFMVIGYVSVARDGVGKVSHADELFTRGMFGLCRNPLYAGNIVIFTGIFLLHGAWPVFAIGFSLFLFLYYAIIFSEEAYLGGKFKSEWDQYRATTPRLLPRLSNWKSAVAGMEFSVKRAIFIENNVMTLAAIMVAFSLWYKSYTATDVAMIPLVSAILLFGGLGFIASISVLKKFMA